MNRAILIIFGILCAGTFSIGVIWHNNHSCVTQVREVADRNKDLLSRYDIEALKRLGINDPIESIKSDLRAHPELIPYDGVLGGRMGFYGERIVILSSKWVYAEFEDGHIGGCMLLEYQVLDNGIISWKVIDSYLD